MGKCDGVNHRLKEVGNEREGAYEFFELLECHRLDIAGGMDVQNEKFTFGCCTVWNYN